MHAISAEHVQYLMGLGLEEDFDCEPLAGGANNRVFRLRDSRRDWVLKCYYRHPMDPRDRFGAERGFYQLTWGAGIRRTPEPVAWEEHHQLGVLTHISGRRLTPAGIGPERLMEALDFITDIQGASSAGAVLPPASEACFSVTEHLACVERRLGRLEAIQLQEPVDAQARDFVQKELKPRWRQIKAQVSRGMPGGEAGLRAPLPSDCRCLSPSDFGFHNAVLAGDGCLRFFDFEYAGWDDPAKLVCDFFCQPKVPVALSFWDYWVGALSRRLPAWRDFAERAVRLLPVYQVKWCCIMLNEFVRGDSDRRVFAIGQAAGPDRRRAQLDQARSVWQRIG